MYGQRITNNFNNFHFVVSSNNEVVSGLREMLMFITARVKNPE